MIREAYSISSLLTILLTLVFGSLIFFRGRGGRAARAYFELMILIALWSAGMFNLVMASSPGQALIWTRLLFIFASFVPVVYSRFIIKLIAAEKKNRSFLFIGYAIATCFSALVFTQFLFKGTDLKLGIYMPVAGRFFWIYAIYFLAYPLASHIIAVSNLYRLTNLAKKQLKYITIAACFGFGAGASTFLSVYDILLPRLVSIAIFFIPFSCTFIAIATYTARLVDIDLLRRRTFIFSILYSLVVGLFVSLIFILQNMLQVRYDINRFILPVVALFIITIFIRPLEQLLIRWTDKYLYQKKYNYQKILENASRGMIFISNVDRLLKLIVRVLSKHMRVTNVAVYLYDKSTNTFKCNAARTEEIEIQKVVNASNALVEWLKEKRMPLLLDDVINWLQKEALFPHKIVLKRTLEQLRLAMRSLKASVCVPAFTRADMSGFLVIGDKLSGRGYTKDDIALLDTLSNSAAIAIENAKMYDELHNRINRISELYKEQHGLFIDTATAFSYAVDLRDTYSRQHTQRIIGYCMVIIRGLDKMNAGYSKEPDFMENLKIAALLHDVGKVSIPDAILNKEGLLTPEERKMVNNHINIAVEILKPIEELGPITNIVKYHHEFYNGKGYPEGLSGEDIPFASRILSVANAYDAMTSDRPYRKAMSHQRAAEQLKKGSGKDFDPMIVEALLVGFEGMGTTRGGEALTPSGEVPPVLY